MKTLDLVSRPLQRQLRALAVALRAGSTERARAHAANAAALVNEATDLALSAHDLLAALADGARTGRSGSDVIERLLEVGVRKRLDARSRMAGADVATAPRAVDAEALRREVRRLLGASESAIDRDPRWSDLLDGS
jgi:hypothetical protein